MIRKDLTLDFCYDMIHTQNGESHESIRQRTKRKIDQE